MRRASQGRAALVQENGWMQSTGRCAKAIELRWLLRVTNSAPERSKRWPKMSRFNCTQYGKANGDFKLSPHQGNSARCMGGGGLRYRRRRALVRPAFLAAGDRP